ncbi:MAG TPA: acyl-CoA dehydrogenase family protein [Terriglobales bacterium]|jgi:acyl-CoA dehydrogenase|nr:acyl-CoA dehydrogenase family protein [Terriglobales bacterium]
MKKVAAAMSVDILRSDVLRSPVQFLQHLGIHADHAWLRDYETWFESEGQGISDAVDRAGTPWLRMFDQWGARVDEILYPPEYWRMLKRGYRSGVLWRAFENPEQKSLLSAYLLLYATGFCDAGLACPYTVSLSTLCPLSKYGDAELQARFLPRMLRRDDTVWQGATWMTEIKGGSDLGAAVETVAQKERDGNQWRLTGDKYFASNAGAELAVVAARPEGAPQNVRGLSLFLVPRHREDGQLNYQIRRLKDKIATRSVPTGEIELLNSEGWLLGQSEQGIYLILEVLNLSRVANCIGSVALAQRALADAYSYAQRRTAFGKPIIEHPLLSRQFEDRARGLHAASKLAWEAVHMLDEVWQEKPPYSDRYHLFRLIAHLAKYWTAEFAVHTAKWAMEVYGGVGTLQENRVERWLREAMILAIWEGTSHRQMLDGLEVMQRKAAHRLLFHHLAGKTAEPQLRDMEARVERQLALPEAEREATLVQLFSDLAAFTAAALSNS